MNRNDKPIPRLSYHQYRTMRKLVHECCNNFEGNCLLLDHGEECVCVQSISYSLLCKWFRVAVLPLDNRLYTELLHPQGKKRCNRCGKVFLPKTNRGKYCPDWAIKARREQEAKRQRERYRLSTHLDHCKAFVYKALQPPLKGD